MPFKWKWPFKWPWSKAETPPAEAVAPTAPAAAAEPVQRAPAALPEPRPAAASIAVPDGPEHDLGAALLDRASARGVPPTLGERGGLAEMARALPEVDRFLQRLPSSPAQAPGLIGPAAEITTFAASLPGLGNLAATAAEGATGFPEQLEPRPVQTEVLPPLGGPPDQVPGLSGAAPVLETPAQAVASAAAAAGLPASAVQRQVVAPLDVVAPSPTAPALTELAPAIVPATETLTLAGGAALTLIDSAPMSQVLAPAAVLTGNVLPVDAPAASVQREAEPLVSSPSGPTEFLRPAETAHTVERVTVVEREIIESQRGQGQPLPAETRAHFEQAFGQSLGDVRIHTGTTAQRVSESLNAAAFATGSDVFFAPGIFQPDQPAGLHVVGHELAHVIQQRYGSPPGDVDTLQPPSHPAERQAEALAARAVATPMVTPGAGEPPAPPLQRAAASGEDPRLFQGPARLPSERHEPEVLGRAERFDAPPLSTAALLGATAAPVQRFSADEFAGLRQSLPNETPLVQPIGAPAARPALENTPARVGGLTASLPNPGGMLANLNSAARNLPAQSFYNTTQIILGGSDRPVPVLSRAVDLNALTDNLPGLPQMPEAPTLDSLAGQLTPPELPDVSSLAQGLPDRLPSLPTLDGLRLPDMPLAPSMGDLTQLAANAAATGQEAVGSVMGAAQSAVESATPALPNMEKLTEQIWKSIQQKLRVERERSRGLA